MEATQLGNIKKLSESLFSFEQGHLLEHGSTMPVQYIIKDHGVVAIPTPFSDYNEKVKMSQFTTFMAGLLDADAIIFLSEAWYSIQEAPKDICKDDPVEERHRKARRLSKPPSQDPNRKEKLMMLVFFGNGESMLGHSEIVRAGSMNRPYTKEFEWFSEEPSKEQSTSLFRPWKVPEAEAIIEKISANLPEEIKLTLEELKESLRSGKTIKDQISNSREVFGTA